MRPEDRASYDSGFTGFETKLGDRDVSEVQRIQGGDEERGGRAKHDATSNLHGRIALCARPRDIGGHRTRSVRSNRLFDVEPNEAADIMLHPHCAGRGNLESVKNVNASWRYQHGRSYKQANRGVVRDGVPWKRQRELDAGKGNPPRLDPMPRCRRCDEIQRLGRDEYDSQAPGLENDSRARLRQNQSDRSEREEQRDYAEYGETSALGPGRTRRPRRDERFGNARVIPGAPRRVLGRRGRSAHQMWMLR